MRNAAWAGFAAFSVLVCGRLAVALQVPSRLRK